MGSVGFELGLIGFKMGLFFWTLRHFHWAFCRKLALFRTLRVYRKLPLLRRTPHAAVGGQERLKKNHSSPLIGFGIVNENQFLGFSRDASYPFEPFNGLTSSVCQRPPVKTTSSRLPPLTCISLRV
jgi:hypothetical protein